MKRKIKNKGMSEIVSAILAVVLVMALIAVVWSVVSNMVNKELKNTESCFGNFNKVTINEAYTCFNITSSETYFSIGISDIDVDRVILSIGSEGSTNTYVINYTSQSFSSDFPITNYPSNSSGISAPGKNSGKTYIYHGFNKAPDYIRIAPVIGEETCQESDSITNIEICSNY